MDKSGRNTFLVLSKELTGFDDLSGKISESHFSSVKKILVAFGKAERSEAVKFEPDQFALMLGAYEEGKAQMLYSNPKFTPILKEILFLWYTGFPSEQSYSEVIEADIDGYFESLLWRAISAHPPGLSGGYFGHWHYLPDS